MVTKNTTAKPRAKRKSAEHKAKLKAEIKPEALAEHKHSAHAPKSKYIYATGRRKTSVANVRLFEGKGEFLVNKKPLKGYFNYSYFEKEALQPFSVTGLEGKYHALLQVNGGGLHSQAKAISHGFALALGKVSEEVRKVLKKNGFLTRDDRRKERKKPGLKRARRSPQWSKR